MCRSAFWDGADGLRARPDSWRTRSNASRSWRRRCSASLLVTDIRRAARVAGKAVALLIEQQDQHLLPLRVIGAQQLQLPVRVRRRQSIAISKSVAMTDPLDTEGGVAEPDIDIEPASDGRATRKSPLTGCCSASSKKLVDQRERLRLIDRVQIRHRRGVCRSRRGRADAQAPSGRARARDDDDEGSSMTTHCRVSG